MRKLLSLLLCLALLPLALASAEQAPGPLSLAEIELFHQVILEKAMADGLTPVQDGAAYTLKGQGYELQLASPDLSQDSLVLSAALILSGSGHGLSLPRGPRGLVLDSPASDLLALFANDNPHLAGTPASAVLYILGSLPTAVHTGFVLRDGQHLSLVEYNVFFQADAGVSRAGMQFIIDQGALVAMRSFLPLESMPQQEAQEELFALQALQEQSAYIAHGDTAGSQLSREDLDLAGLDFFDSTPESAVALLGEAHNRDQVDNSDGSQLLILQWPGLEAVFRQDDAGSTCQRLTVSDLPYEGPRGLRVGDTLAQAISRFEHGEDGGSKLYGDGQNPPYGLMVEEGGDATLYYVIDAETGSVGLMLTFIQGLLVDLTITNF